MILGYFLVALVVLCVKAYQYPAKAQKIEWHSEKFDLIFLCFLDSFLWPMMVPFRIFSWLGSKRLETK